MLKNKHLWLLFGLILAISNIIAITSSINNLTIISNLQQNKKNKINSIVTNTTYGSLSNGTILSSQDNNGTYHLFDIKNIINNSKLEPYAKYINITNNKLSYNPDDISKEIIDEFNKEIAIINYNEQQLTSTNDLQIFQKQNLSKISTTVYKSNKKSDKKFTFIQFGGANLHVSLEGTEGIVDKITDYNDLSETLGIYYIAKSHAKNSRTICLDFVKQFISKSSLKNSKNINDKIFIAILNSMIDNENLTSIINDYPIKNDSKNMSIRYLLNDDNIVSVGYYQYNISDLDTINNLIFSYNFPKDGAQFIEYDSKITSFLKWSDYADSWTNFTFLYPIIFAGVSDNIIYTVMGNTTIIKSDKLNFSTKKIENKDKQLPVWRVINQPPPGHKSQGLVIYIFIWHDENMIYQQIKSTSISRAFDVGPSFSININKWTISNILK